MSSGKVAASSGASPGSSGASAASAAGAGGAWYSREARQMVRASPSGMSLALAALLIAVLLGGCYRQQMAAQPKYDPLEPSDFFADGMAARPRVAGTVARGELVGNDFLNTGKVGSADGDGLPFPATAALLARGQERFNIYCSECHGRVGNGDGMIPRRGFRRPPSYHTPTLRAAATGHFFDVITNGFGAMPPYGTMIPRDDRWAIIAYIRALQLSQNATIDDVADEDRTRLSAGGTR
jgi:mono/diheme cytochrome c family protein